MSDNKSLLKTIAGIAAIGYISINLMSQNGMYDSLRTKEAKRYIQQSDITKVVADVEEEWRDNSTWSLIGFGNGYNPRVIKTVTFEDGTETKLDYRTMAHQPFRKWSKGDEFNPKKGETYKVSENNTILSKLRNQ